MVEALQDSVWGLVPQLLLSGTGVVVNDGLSLSGLLPWRGSVLGRLVAPLVDTPRELSDLAAVCCAMVGIGVDRA